MRSGLFLSGLRRTGKTTFVITDLIPALEALGAIVIYVDLWSDVAANPATLTHDAVKRALKDLAKPSSAVRDRLKRVSGLDVGVLGFSFGFSLDAIGNEGGVTLAQALSELVDLAKTDVVLIMDEVQQAITTEAGQQMLLGMKAARDAINARPHKPGYFLFVGTGSHRAQVSELTTRRNQAFTGAISQPYPVLGRPYVEYLLDRLRLDGVEKLPATDLVMDCFKLLGHRPEELLKALQVWLPFSDIEGDGNTLFSVIAQTLKTTAADAEIAVIDNLGGLATAIFDRLTDDELGLSLFSADAASQYSKTVGRKVRVLEIQPVVNKLLAANIVMRKGHGNYLVADPFVRDAWIERRRAAKTLPSARPAS